MEPKKELLSKFFAKARIVNDSDLNELLKLDDIWKGVYEEHRIKKNFYQAELLANQAVIESVQPLPEAGEEENNFKNSPIHNKLAIISLMDKLYPEQMIEVVDLLQKIKSTQDKEPNNTEQSDAYYERDKLFERNVKTCNCAMPYFPTGDIKHCSKCGKKTVY